MPPLKVRTAPDDSRSEASSTKEKLGNMATSAPNGKGGRRVASGLGITSSLRDVASIAGAGTGTTASAASGQDGTAGVCIARQTCGPVLTLCSCNGLKSILLYYTHTGMPTV